MVRFAKSPPEVSATYNPTEPVFWVLNFVTVNEGVLLLLIYTMIDSPCTTKRTCTHESGAGAGVMALSYFPGYCSRNTCQVNKGFATYWMALLFRVPVQL